MNSTERNSRQQWCPVCGYGFGEPIRDSMICRCCGTQFGYHDSAHSHAALRGRWLAEGGGVAQPPGPAASGVVCGGAVGAGEEGGGRAV